MPGVVSADLFERVIPMLPLLSTFERKKRFKCNTYLERLAQNLLIITMVFVMVLFANDVFDVGYYVLCYENNTVVTKKDINICEESMKPSNETQAPEYLTLMIGILLVCMFLINRLWEFCFQNCIRQHVEEAIFEINDSVYRAMVVNISENTPQHENRNRIYKKPLTLHIESISPMGTCKCIGISFCFILKNLAYCCVAGGLMAILVLLVKGYKEEFKECKIENRNLLCTIPEYHTLKYIQILAIACSSVSSLIILVCMCWPCCCINSCWNSFLAVYNNNIIPDYNYESLEFQHRCSMAWGIILLYLKGNDSMLIHYRYLNSLRSIHKEIDRAGNGRLLSNQNEFQFLKDMKQQTLIDMFDKDLPVRVLS